MLRKLYILVIIFLFSFCKPHLSKSPAQYSSLLGILMVSALAGTSPAKFVATDFMAIDTVSPVVIYKSQKLGIFMDKDMTTDCALSINGVVQSSIVSLSTDKREIFFTPSVSGWPVSLENISYLNFSNCKDASGATVANSGNGAPVYIADGVIFLDGTNGLDTNYTGATSGDPLYSLNAALSAITSKCTGACAILMKGGVYPIPASVTMPTNVSLFGGFDPSDWKKRRADKTMLAPYDTIIDDLSANVTGTGVSPYSSLKYVTYTGTKDKTVLDGIAVYSPFTVNASSYSAPIGAVNLQAGAGITVRNTYTLDRSSTINVTSAGFVSSNSSGTIVLKNSSLNGSNSTAASCSRYGMVYNGSNSGSVLEISSSSLTAGAATTASSGFFPTGSVQGSVSITDSAITGPACSGCISSGINILFGGSLVLTGNTISTSGTNLSSLGIDITGGTVQVTNNTVNAGPATANSIGIKISTAGTGHTISGNKITSSSGANSKGIEVTVGTGHIITGNTITSASGTASTVGIDITGSGIAVSSIDNNIINSGVSSNVGTVFGIRKNTNTTLTISNNTVTTPDCRAGSCANNGITAGDGAGTDTTNILNNTITAGGGEGGSNAAIYCNNGTFTVSGNTINGPNCSVASCMTSGIDAGFGTPYTITNNTVTSGTCTGSNCQQRAIRLAAGSPTLTMTGNLLDSGTPSASTINRYALLIESGGAGWSAGSSIQRNTFINRPGVGNSVTVSITPASATGNPLLFCSNVMIGGNITSGANNSTVLLIGNATSIGNKFMGNTYIGGTVVSGLSNLHKISNSTVKHNLDLNLFAGDSSVAASTTCVSEASGDAQYATLERNNFSGCNTLYSDNGGATSMTMTCGGNIGTVGCGVPPATLANPTGQNNQNATPIFMNPSGMDFHLNASTNPVIYSGLIASDITAFNTACGNVLDRDGNTRAAGTAIGAFK